MRADVTFVVNDTVETRRIEGPILSTQEWDGGRALIIVKSLDHKKIRAYHFRQAEFIDRDYVESSSVD